MISYCLTFDSDLSKQHAIFSKMSKPTSDNVNKVATVQEMHGNHDAFEAFIVLVLGLFQWTESLTLQMRMDITTLAFSNYPAIK